MKVILASTSPRRLELLRMVGLAPRVVAPEVDESRAAGEPVDSFVERVARAKGLSAYRRENYPDLIVSADTVVLVGRRMIGKPRDPAEAEEMLRLLSGRSHDVLTGVALMHRGVTSYGLERTRVRFAPIDEPQLAYYLRHADYMDKAGAYAIQDLAALFIAGISGCFFNVMGFPLHLFHRLSRELGLELFAEPPAPRPAASRGGRHG